MNINEVVEEANKMSNYVKLKDGEIVRGKFKGEIDRVKTDFIDDKTGANIIKYECAFKFTDGVEKTWSGSASFFKECHSRSELKGKEFSDCVFAVKREGSGRYDTKYIVEVIDNAVIVDTPSDSDGITEDLPF